MNSTFRDSVTTQWLTHDLFLETTTQLGTAVYTLRDEDVIKDGKTYKSLGKLYVESDDPTEYTFATQHLGGWAHWTYLKANATSRIKNLISDWKIELEAKLVSQSIKQIAEVAAGGSVQASRWLAERSWKPTKRGRPSKEEIEGERKFQARLEDEISDDLERIKKH